MTGFEIAGIVLGAFPLLIEGLRIYMSSTETLKDLWQSQRRLKRLVTSADLESTILENTLEMLLQGVVDEGQIFSLVKGEGWKEIELHEKLAQRMGNNFTRCFVNVVQEIKEDLDKVITELKLNEPHVLTSSTEPFPITRDRWKAIKTVLKRKGLEELLQSISTKNQKLHYIVESLPQYESIKSHSQIPSYIARRCQLLREHAINAYKFLRRKLSNPECSCTLKHSASLQLDAFPLGLDWRNPNHPSSATSDIDEVKKLKMMISFDPGFGRTMSDWLELDFQLKKLPVPEISVQEALAPNDQTRDDQVEAHSQDGDRKKNLRAWLPVLNRKSRETSPNPSPEQGKLRPKKGKSVAFATLPPSQTPVAVSMPEAKVTTPMETFQITFCQLGEVISIRRTLPPKSIEMLDELEGLSYLLAPTKLMRESKAICLEELLQQRVILICDRLKIALQLSFLVLQLYNTKWLPTLWSAKDILFLTERRNLPMAMDDGSSCRYGYFLNPILEKPLIQQSPLELGEPVAETRRSMIGIYNETIYSLGKVLVELALEESLQEGWPSDEQLIRVTNGVGPKYATAANNCLSRFGSSLTLDDKKMKDEFYERVVLPLQDQLQLANSGGFEDLE